MRLTTKRALDFYVGRPLLSALHALARLAGMVITRDHATLPVRTVLIVKFQGIGSLIIAKPAIAALRSAYPEARILLWGTPAMVPLAEQMPEIDEILVLDDRSMLRALMSLFGTLFTLWRRPVDWAFDLEAYSRLSSVLVTLSFARNRTGFALEQLRSRRVHTHLVYFNRYLHIGEAYGRLVGQLLPTGRTVNVSDFGTWRTNLEPLAALQQPYFLVNIHAGDLALERRWPRESFAALISALLARRADAVVVLIGHGAREVAYVAPLLTHERIVDLSGKLTMLETLRAIANAELVITNDTAPLHMALSTAVPLVALFGPTRAETYLTPGRPRTAKAQEAIYCSPCVHHWEPPPCSGDNQCMKRITVEQVFARCCELLLLPAPSSGEIAATEPMHSMYYPGLVYRRTLASDRS